MELIQRIRGGLDRVGFIIWHSTTPEIADRARAVVLSNQQYLNQMLDAGLVTQERLEEISKDPELQNKYRRLMRAAGDGGNRAEDAGVELVELRYSRPDEMAGWFEYFRKFFERKWGLKLLSPEDLTELSKPSI